MNNYSMADIAALMRNGNCDGMTGNNSYIWLLFIFLFFGRDGFGANGGGAAAQGALTRAELNEGFANNQVMNKLNGLENGLAQGFYAQNTTMLQGFNTIGSQISQSAFDAQKCCCETNRNIDSVRYDAAKNTCDIIRAIEKDGDQTRHLITQNTIQELRDKLIVKDNALQSANLTIQNNAQTQTLVSELRPCPVPAYPACNPYGAANPFASGCGY